MAKKRINKTTKAKIQKLYPSLICISILFMSIGYAIINSVILKLDGSLIAKNQSGIFITEAKYLSNSNADTSKSKIIKAYGTMLNTDITLSQTVATSSITYQITIYNGTAINYIFDGVSYSIGTDTYSNEDIIFSLSNLKIGDKLETKKSVTFNITFSYKNKVLSESPNLLSYLTFNFVVDESIIATYDYTGTPQTFTAPETGTYRLETWGAQGGTYSEYKGGYGTYSTGEVKLTKGEKLYIYVGGEGGSTNIYDGAVSGGFNGGGNGVGWWASSNIGSTNEKKQSGGGATHIALKDNYIDMLTPQDLLIISAGGSGAIYFHVSDNSVYAYCQGGNGGGIEGNTGECDTNLMYALESYSVPTQTSPGTSQYAGYLNSGKYGIGSSGFSGGGGGYYGGSGGYLASSGGSSHIGNTRLTNKKMVCNNCTESALDETRTVSTTQHSKTPTSNIPKEGNGYAQITILSSEEKEQKDGIYIQSIEYNGNVSADTNSSQIINYSGNEIHSNIYLSNTNANSSITYKVTIYNNDDVSYYYNGLLYDLGSDTYSNTGITISTTNITTTQEIKPKTTKTIYLTYTYKDGTLASSNNLKSFIKLNFQETICPTDGTICDISGNNNHLNIVGATWDRYKGEIITDGVDDYLYLDLLDFQGTNQFTIEFIALLPKQNHISGGIILFETSINSNAHQGSFYVDTLEYGNNDITLAMKYGQKINHKMADGIIDNSNYRHYTITMNTLNGYDQYTKMYLDATPRTMSLTRVTNADITGYTLSNYPFYVATRAGTSLFAKMQIKELRIYKTALTDEEILSNYNGTIKRDNLIASYNFN